MPKQFNCPSCTEPIIFQGGESLFQTCKSCHAPVIVPSEFLYRKEEQLASEEFASLANDKPVDVEQVTNQLTPGSSLPKAADSLEGFDPEARIEKFEVYQEKIGTDAVVAKKAVDEIIAPKKEVDFTVNTPYASPFANPDNPPVVRQHNPPPKPNLTVRAKPTADQNPASTQKKEQLNPVLVRIQNELETGDKIEAIKIFRSRYNTSLRAAKNAVEAIERGEEIDISKFLG
jgi:hypothetical protein